MIVQCQDCGRQLRVPDSAAGKHARCPSCQTLVPIPAAPPESPPESSPQGSRRLSPRSGSSDSADRGSSQRPAAPRRESNRPRRATRGSAGAGSAGRRPQRRREPAYSESDDETEQYDDFGEDTFSSGYDDPWGDVNPYAAPAPGSRTTGQSGGRSREGLQTAGLGLLIQGGSITAMLVIVAGTLVIGMISGFAGAQNPNAGGGALDLIIGGVVGLLLILAMLGVLVGEFMCITVPQSSGAKGLISTAVVCLTVQIVISVVANLAVPGAGALRVVLASVSGICGITHFVTYLLFQKTVAEYIQRDDLARQAMIVLIGLGSSMAMVILLSLLSVAVGGGGLAIIAGLLILLCGLFSLVFGVMQLFLLFRLGSALRS